MTNDPIDYLIAEERRTMNLKQRIKEHLQNGFLDFGGQAVAEKLEQRKAKKAVPVGDR